MCLIACLESKHNLLWGLLRLVQKLKESTNLKLLSGYCVFTLPIPFFKSTLHRVNQVNLSNLNRTIALPKGFFIVCRMKCMFLKEGAKTLHKAFYIPFQNFPSHPLPSLLGQNQIAPLSSLIGHWFLMFFSPLNWLNPIIRFQDLG